MESIGQFMGEIAEGFDAEKLRDAIDRLPGILDDGEVIASGKNRIVAISAGSRQFVVKRFGLEPGWKDRIDESRGSAALRSWIAARHLLAHGVGTPEPVAVLEKRDSGRLVDSYYITERIADAVSFKDALLHLYYEKPDCEKFMLLLDVVSEGVWDLHACGFQHRDLGNQNILLRPNGRAEWKKPAFIDLNRGRVCEKLTSEQRGRDISRLALPSDLMRAFLDKYCGDVPPEALVRSERLHRWLYYFHHRTRRLRHPIRESQRARKESLAYPSPKDAWIWDERSAQAIGVLTSRDRHRHYPPFRNLRIAGATLAGLPGIWKTYRELLSSAYVEPVEMKNRIGVAVEPQASRVERELELLEELGEIPVLVRVYHHEELAARSLRCKTVRELHEKGHPVCVALVQDRSAVNHPERWKAFCGEVLREVGGCVEMVELGHALNRVKWGAWALEDVRALLGVARELREAYPDVRFTGPACIDFEYPFAVAALGQLSGGERLGGLSHHLYVDRRGAPENRQGQFSLLEKCALARAIARWSDACDDSLIVSEVNWPLEGQGVYSPVGSPYVAPGVRKNDPSISEDQYADFMLRYLCIAIASGFVERVYWWRLAARGFGLVDDSGLEWRRRPAFEMLSTLLRKVSSAGCRVSSDRKGGRQQDLRRFRFESDGNTDFELAYSVDREFDAAAAFSDARFEDALGNPVDAEGFKIGGRPVYVFRND